MFFFQICAMVTRLCFSPKIVTLEKGTENPGYYNFTTYDHALFH